MCAQSNTYKVSAWNSYHIFYFWHCLFSRVYFSELELIMTRVCHTSTALANGRFHTVSFQKLSMKWVIESFLWKTLYCSFQQISFIIFVQDEKRYTQGFLFSDIRRYVTVERNGVLGLAYGRKIRVEWMPFRHIFQPSIMNSVSNL